MPTKSGPRDQQHWQTAETGGPVRLIPQAPDGKPARNGGGEAGEYDSGPARKVFCKFAEYFEVRSRRPRCLYFGAAAKDRHAGDLVANRLQLRILKRSKLEIELKQHLISSVFCALVAASTQAEVVQTTDGRSVELKSDGTYEVIDLPRKRQEAFVELGDHFFEHHSDRLRKAVRFMPKYQNVGDETIVGVKFTAKFLNVFGDEVFQFSGESEETVEPGNTSDTTLFYYFEDNQFMADDAYDKMLAMVTNRSGRIDVVIDMIALAGGELIKISEQ